MGIKDWFAEPKSTEEIEAENEKLEALDRKAGLNLSIAKQNELTKELEARGKKWQDFSTNGTKAGIVWDKVRAFFSSH